MVHTICLAKLRDEAGLLFYVLRDTSGIVRSLTTAQFIGALKSRQLDCENFALSAVGKLIDMKPIAEDILEKDVLNAEEFCRYIGINPRDFEADLKNVERYKDGAWLSTDCRIGFLSRSVTTAGRQYWKVYHADYDERDRTPWDIYTSFEYSFYRESDADAVDMVDSNPNNDMVFSRNIFYGEEQVDSSDYTAGFQFSKSAFNKAACDFITAEYENLTQNYHAFAEVVFYSGVVFECTTESLYLHRSDLLSYLRLRVLTL